MDLTKVYTLTGLTTEQVDTVTLQELAELEGLDPFNLSRVGVYRLAILTLERLATGDTNLVGVSQVEDITVKYDARSAAWLALADRLRAKLDELLEEDDGGPFTIEFHPAGWGGIEAVERG